MEQWNIAVVNDSGAIVQQTDYYPYGEPWSEPTHPFTYSDNERLHAYGQNQYDFHARRLIPMLLRFDHVDPLTENKPWQSPYIYCASNPILYIDPEGTDEFLINEKGYLLGVVFNNEKKHKFKVIKEDGSTKEKEFTIDRKDVEVSDKPSDNYTFKLSGDKNGMDMYKFIVQNTDVEWSLLQTGKNLNGDNYITTSHEMEQEHGVTYLVTRSLKKSVKYRNHIHNHNNGVTSPSRVGPHNDIIMGRSFLNYISPGNVQFYIYTFKDGKDILTPYFPRLKKYDSIYTKRLLK